MEDTRIAYKVLLGDPDGMGHKSKWEDSATTDLIE
jgi:hypothetical protein